MRLSIGVVIIAIGVLIVFVGLYKWGIFHSGIPNDEQGFSQYYQGDYTKAFNKLLPLAQKGDINAQISLGNLYSAGLGVKQDYKEAFYWYNEATKQNNSGAMVNLATMYESGLYVKKDTKKAIELYEKAINTDNNSTAKFNLCLYYLETSKNYKKGVTLLKKAAEQGNPNAQSFLGACFSTGKFNLPVNYDKAYELCQKASEQGNPVAQNNLAVLYYLGKGVPKDDFEAYKWFYLSANYGKYSKAMDLLNEYDFNLTDAQRNKAIEAAKQWAVNHREINSDIVNVN